MHKFLVSLLKAHKTILYFLASCLILAGCQSVQPSEESAPVMLTGKIERTSLANSQYPWFENNYRTYEADSKVVDGIKEKKGNVSVIVFLGTWCGDTKKQLPRFCKVMDKAEFTNIELVAVNREKKSPEGIESGYNIERIPTFVFLKDGKEIGRIIETPQNTMEEDILKILSSF